MAEQRYIMRQQQPTSAAQLKRLLSLLFKAQAIAVELEIDLNQKVAELFGRNLPWAPKVDPIMIHPEETDCVKLSTSQRMALMILKESQEPLTPLEIHRKMSELPDTICSHKYSTSTIRGAVRDLHQLALVACNKVGRREAEYSAK